MDEESPRKGDSHAPSATEFFCFLLLFLGGKTWGQEVDGRQGEGNLMLVAVFSSWEVSVLSLN